MKKELFIQQVLSCLERVIFEGNPGILQNFATFDLSQKHFIQILASRGDFSINCEATGNGFMDTSDHISDVQIEQLQNLGWSEAIGRSNHSLILPCHTIDNRKQIAELFYATAAVYGDCQIANINVEIG